MLKRLLYLQVPFYAVFAIFVILIAFVGRSFEGTPRSIIKNTFPAAILQFGSHVALSDPNYFKSVRDRFLADKMSFIEADLSEMRLRVYNEGLSVKEVPILTKGREGSWWETPAGLYQVQGKEKNHYSGFSKVYMPWSLPFQGNFFIHGWPYYKDGTPVSSTYSGGCVRLRTEDAKAIYDLVEVGTPIIVFEKDFDSDSRIYELKAPAISSAAYLAADLKSNFIFFEKSSAEVVPIASLAKLVTALVAAEYINMDKTITVPSEAVVRTSKPRLYAGQEIQAFQLLYPLLLESSNEAAETFASHLGKERFLRLMNDKAKAIGMEHTTFADPSGSHPDNKSTAEDLFNLAKYLYNNRRFILNISAGRVNNSAYGPPIFSDLQNFNVFSYDPSFVGGKTGLATLAKQTILSVFEIPYGASNRPIVIIALGSQNNAADAEILLRYLQLNYALKSE